nr:uncharacterized protein LOC101950865 [Chrysemys picta bellii]
MDTLVGLEAVESGPNPKDEVVDKEVELEDVVEPTAGWSSTMRVRNSFPVQRGVASSSTQFPESMVQERNVAFRGAPCTLAARLCQIRKQPRWSKLDMFRGVLQSSDQKKKSAMELREMERQDRKYSEECILKVHEQIKVIEEQTEMLKSLITLLAEQMHARPRLQPMQNCFPCPSQTPPIHSLQLPQTSQYPVHSSPGDTFQNDSWIYA